MAPSDSQRSKPGTPASGSPGSIPNGLMDEGPVDISSRLSKKEQLQRTLRLLSPRISSNSLLNPVTGGDPSNFVLGVVKSISNVENRYFWDMPLALIETTDSQYIDPPRKDGRKQPPVMARYFLFGDRHPKTLLEDPKISGFVYDVYLEFEPLEEGGKKLYLFPVESGISRALARISTVPPPPIEGVSERNAGLFDVSSLSVYLPSNVAQAREILLSHKVHDGAPLDLMHIHDNLEEVTTVQFTGEEKKSLIPFAVLKLSGGADFRLYSYGKTPPQGSPPMGCEIILSNDKFYLIMPGTVAHHLQNQLLSNHLSL